MPLYTISPIGVYGIRLQVLGSGLLGWTRNQQDTKLANTFQLVMNRTDGKAGPGWMAAKHRVQRSKVSYGGFLELGGSLY